MKPTTNLLNKWNYIHEKIGIICCLLMIAGLFFSRALLSLSMFVMFVNALHPRFLKQYWNEWSRNVFSILCTAFFFSYFISGLWSADSSYWLKATINKLPFVILPFAFLSIPLHKEKVQRLIIFSLAAMQLLLIGYSLVELALHWDYYMKGYHFSRPIPTTKYNDHIRFSLSLVLSFFIIMYLLLEKKKELINKTAKWILTAILCIFFIYIHILAAKSGILCLYLGMFVFVIFRIGRKNKLLALFLTLVIASLPFLGYIFVPTFKTKIDYVRYEQQKTKEDKHYDYTLSDAGRMITYDIGTKAIKEHPALGVGAGDLMDEMREGYGKYYPEVTEEQQFGPINQFLFTALSVGIPLSLILLAMCIAPFLLKVNDRIYLIVTALALFISLMVEAPLELQFGVFTYLFFILTWISILKKPTTQ
jgi:O-antigen ligase